MGEREHEAYLRRAVALACEGVDAGLGGPFGALVVLDGRVVGSGCNRVTSSGDPTAHAEIVAIRAACRELGRYHLNGAILYASCEPCPMCLAAASWARVGAIYHARGSDVAARAGFDDVAIRSELLRPAAERRIPLVMLPLEGGDEPFERWARSPHRREY